MNERQDHLPGDLKALRYLDALESGDLEAIAALWDEASHDAELEAILADVDKTLFAEAAIGKHKAGKDAMLRPVPTTLSPPQTKLLQWHWATGVGGLAAACLLAVFAWQGRIGDGPVVTPKPPVLAHQVVPRPQVGSAGIAAWRESWRILEGAEATPFVWPLPESSLTASISIPPDLLN